MTGAAASECVGFDCAKRLQAVSRARRRRVLLAARGNPEHDPTFDRTAGYTAGSVSCSKTERLTLRWAAQQNRAHPEHGHAGCPLWVRYPVKSTVLTRYPSAIHRFRYNFFCSSGLWEQALRHQGPNFFPGGAFHEGFPSCFARHRAGSRRLLPPAARVLSTSATIRDRNLPARFP